MNIHIKEAEAVDATIRCILDQGLTPEDVYIAGDPGVLEKALDIAPRIPRCCLAGSDTPEKQLGVPWRIDAAGYSFGAADMIASPSESALNSG